MIQFYEKIEDLSNLYNKKIYPLSIHNNIGIDLLVNDICKIESSTKKNISFQYNDNDKKINHTRIDKRYYQ